LHDDRERPAKVTSFPFYGSNLKNKMANNVGKRIDMKIISRSVLCFGVPTPEGSVPLIFESREPHVNPIWNVKGFGKSVALIRTKKRAVHRRDVIRNNRGLKGKYRERDERLDP